MPENSPEKEGGQELKARIEKALQIADESTDYQGHDRKLWVIDQMVRELTGCPTEQGEATDYKGVKYTYEALGESEEYRKFVDKVGEHIWETGTIP